MFYEVVIIIFHCCEYAIKQMHSHSSVFPTDERRFWLGVGVGPTSPPFAWCLNASRGSAWHPSVSWLCAHCCVLVDHEFCEYVSFSFYIHSVWHRADTHLLNLIWPNSSSCLAVMMEEDELNGSLSISHGPGGSHTICVSPDNRCGSRGPPVYREAGRTRGQGPWQWLHSKEWTRAQDCKDKSVFRGQAFPEKVGLWLCQADTFLGPPGQCWGRWRLGDDIAPTLGKPKSSDLWEIWGERTFGASAAGPGGWGKTKQWTPWSAGCGDTWGQAGRLRVQLCPRGTLGNLTNPKIQFSSP